MQRRVKDLVRLFVVVILVVSVPAMASTAPVVGSKKQVASKVPAGKTTKRGVSKSGVSNGTGKVAKSKKRNRGLKNSKNSNTSVKPVTSADVKRQQRETQDEIKKTKQEIRDNDRAVKKNLRELGLLEEEISSGKREVDVANRKVGEIDGEIGRIGENILKEEKELGKLRDEYLRAVKKMQARRGTNSLLAFLFSSSDFKEGMRRLRYMRQFSKWREKRSREIGERVEVLQRQKEKLAGLRRQQGVVLEQRVNAQRVLEKKFNRQDAVVAELKQHGDQLQRHLAVKQREADALKRKVGELIVLEEQKAKRERDEARRREKEKTTAPALKQESPDVAKVNSAPEKNGEASKQRTDKKKKEKKSRPENRKGSSMPRETNVDKEPGSKQLPKKELAENGPVKKESSKPDSGGANTGFAACRGNLPRPVGGSFKITGRFGRHSLPDMPNVVYDNPGIDARVQKGASVSAVFGGKVSGVYVLPGYNTVVIVNHGDYYTVYGNLASASVRTGDSVKQGGVLGRVASDPDDQDAGTIHFEVWKNRDKLDPASWIR